MENNAKMHGFYAYKPEKCMDSTPPVDENEPSGAAEEAQRNPKGPTVRRTTLKCMDSTP